MAGISSFKNIQPNNLIDELVSYIDKQLPSFTNSDSFVEILIKRKNENQHSKAFCNYMNFQQEKLKFEFSPETSQRGPRSVDIGIYLKGGVLLFTLEAKVLPIPIDNKREEHEYVYGNGGGIQRFKDENHGIDNYERLLPQNGMVAYIKEKDFEHWYTVINQWILEASWPSSEQLTQLAISKTASLRSIHTRKNGSKVTLYHFWVCVN